MTTDSDVVIVGAGAVGICSAYYAFKRGLKVTVIDKGDICSGSSYGNAGLVVPSHCIPLASPKVMAKALRSMFTQNGPIYLKPRFSFELLSWLYKFRQACNSRSERLGMAIIRELSIASSRLFEQLAVDGNFDFGYKKQGYLRLYLTKAGLAEGEREAQLLSSIGVESRMLDIAGVRQLEPGLQVNASGGVFFPEDSHLIPSRFVWSVAQYLSRHAAQICTSAEVVACETSGRQITKVRTTRGDFTAKQIVLAAGSWLPGVAEQLQIKVPIQAAKGYSFTFKTPCKSPQRPLSLGEVGVAVTPMGEWLRFSGSFELVGLDLSLNRSRSVAILKGVSRYLPDLESQNLELVELWRGLRPCTPDGLPIVGRARQYDNLIIAGGHAMIGISLAPVTGKLVSELLMEDIPSIELYPLRVDRF